MGCIKKPLLNFLDMVSPVFISFNYQNLTRECLMTRMNRELSFENLNVMEFAVMLRNGVFLIPAFQRDFIWDMQNIINLWDSLYHFYPVGAILYWDTDIRLNIHRKLGGYVVTAENETNGDNMGNRSYILDGQQRATALFFALFGGKGKTKDMREFDYTLYFNAADASFFPADEYNRRSLDINPAFLIRLGDVPRWPEDFHRKIKLEKGFRRKIGANLHQLGRVFSDYKLPLTRLKGFDIRGVCDVFERINQEGRRLKSMDLLISRNFHNYSALVDWL